MMQGESVINVELVHKLWEIVEDLAKLNKMTMNELAQYRSVEEYEYKQSKILDGYDVIIE